MKRSQREAARVLWCMTLARLVGCGGQQLTEAQVGVISQRWTREFSPESQGGDERAWAALDRSDPSRVGRYTYVTGRVFVTLDANGELEDYRDGSRELAASSIGPDPTLSDEKAESLAWTTARTVGASSSLRVTRVERSLEPGVVRVVLLPKVNGYVAVGADSLECRFLSTTGALISLRVRRGWSYETPRIAVSREAAMASANQRFGSGGLWECELKYVAVGNDGAPTELRKMYAGKTARLCYVLFRKSDQQRLLVDSTNGAILAAGRLSTADALGLPSGGGKVVYANKFGRFVKTAGVADWWRTLVTLGLAVGAAGLTVFLAMRTYRRMKQSA